MSGLAPQKRHVMSWSVSASGKVEDVRKAIAEQCAGNSSIDADGHGSVLGMIDAQLAKLGELLKSDGKNYGWDGGTAAADGTAWDGGMNLSIKVSGTKLPG